MKVLIWDKPGDYIHIFLSFFFSLKQKENALVKIDELGVELTKIRDEVGK